MDEKKRPGGLTALAVINFLFAGLSIIGIIGMVFTMNMSGNIPTDGMPEAQKAQIAALQSIDPSTFAVTIGISAVLLILLLLSGIGYLQQKRVLGRIIGNIYAFFGIISVLISVLILPKEIGGGFGVSAIIGLVYPALTLVLLDTVFKNDLDN